MWSRQKWVAVLTNWTSVPEWCQLPAVKPFGNCLAQDWATWLLAEGWLSTSVAWGSLMARKRMSSTSNILSLENPSHSSRPGSTRQPKMKRCRNVKNKNHGFITTDTLAQVYEANAMCLATASADGFPSARMVLLKKWALLYGGENLLCWLVEILTTALQVWTWRVHILHKLWEQKGLGAWHQP